ncbi:MAG: carbohydrate-binding domain-containing protein [Clostridia bacterium]|nr:carbohydrate-binding domain-containing protein [Clostridia bacterium]
MRRKQWICMILAVTLAVCSACAPKEQTKTTEEGNESAPNATFATTASEMFTERDLSAAYENGEAVSVTLEGAAVTATSDSVKIKGSTVTLTEEATYLISGELENGMIIVDAPDTAKLQLVFCGAHITNASSAALYVKTADKVFLTLADGTANTLTSGERFTAIDENNIDGALFSKQDLTINGGGALSVTSPAGHGIVCKDDLVMVGGNCTVTAASHGLDANDSVRLTQTTLKINAGKDAVHAENTEDTSLGFVYIADGDLQAEAQGDCVSAAAWLQIAGGRLDLLAGGGYENGSKEQSDSFGGFMGGGPGGMGGGMRPGRREGEVANTAISTVTTEESGNSMKGLKAGAGMLISDGSITVNSADDALHSDTSLTVSGGTFAIASGDDALHAEETLTVTAGKIDISQSYEGLEALQVDVQGGETKLIATDDGVNAAGGNDQSGFTGGRDGMFGGGMGGGPGGKGGGMSANSNGSIKVSGGTLYINSSGDGMDANGTLEISGGFVTVVGPTRGDTATLDYDLSATISGGTFVGTGAAGMAQTFSDSTQGVISVSVGNQAAGTKILLQDNRGNTLLEHTPELDFAVVIYSAPEIKKGETYTVTVGADSAEITAN